MALAHNLALLRDLSRGSFTEELAKTGLSRRTCYYLLSLISVQEKLQLSDDDLKAIGWTKLQVVSKHLTEDNQRELIEAARNMTAAELSATLGGQKNVGASRCLLLRFSPDEYEFFRSAMIAQGARAHGKGLIGTEAALLRALEAINH